MGSIFVLFILLIVVGLVAAGFVTMKLFPRTG